MSHHEAFEHHDHADHSPSCKFCSSSHDPEHPLAGFGLCHRCVFKILIVVLIVMISISYIAWFGVF